MNIIHQSSLAPIRWKNGGGLTRELLRVPAQGPAFRWRVSIAQIDVPGPFSDFGGYRRWMVLLGGGGVRLTFHGTRASELRNPGDLAQFDGSMPTMCELLGGPCTDLNLIAAQPMRVTAWVERLREPRLWNAAPAVTHLAFPITGPVALAAGDGDRGACLAAWDLAVLGPENGHRSIGPPQGSAVPLVFFATLEDN